MLYQVHQKVLESILHRQVNSYDDQFLSPFMCGYIINIRWKDRKTLSIKMDSVIQYVLYNTIQYDFRRLLILLIVILE